MTRLLLCVLLFFTACAKEEVGSGLHGTWERNEQFINPGNAGTWTAVNDDPRVWVRFSPDGGISSNHSYYGRFSAYRITAPDSILLTSAEGKKEHIRFAQFNNQLTLRYTCREGCGDNFLRK